MLKIKKRPADHTNIYGDADDYECKEKHEFEARYIFSKKQIA